jgi:hypothetical protein
MGSVANSYMTNGLFIWLNISSYITKTFLIYYFASHLNFLIFEENFVFFFISAAEQSLQDRATRKRNSWKIEDLQYIKARSVHDTQNFLIKSEKRWQKKDI